METLITDIAHDVNNNSLDDTIQNFINGKYYYGEKTTVDEWKLLNYSDLRRWSYPDFFEYIDAHVKLKSKDNTTEVDGQKQLDIYINKCLNVKIKFPKN